MNIIEQFYVLFKGDATDLKRTTQEAKKSVQSLQDALTGVFPKEQEERIGKSFVSAIKGAAALLGATTAAYKVFTGIKSANDYALQLGDASRALNVNVTDLDAWGNAVKRTGGTAQGFQQSLQALSQHFGANATVALAALPKLADVFHRLGSFRALQYGKMLGLDQATILLLQQGRREVEDVIRRQKELGTVTQQNVQDAQNYRKAQTELDTAFRTLYLTLAHEVIPIFTEVYRSAVPVIEYFVRHKDLITGAFIAIGGGAAVLAAPFVIANASVIALTASLALLVAAFAIVFEDIKYFKENKPSLIGILAKPGSVARSVLTGIPRHEFSFLHPMEKLTNSLDQLIQVGQNLLISAEGTPLNSQSSAAFTNSAYSRNSSVNTGPITINTQATDAVGLSKDLGLNFDTHLAQTANNFADGKKY